MTLKFRVSNFFVKQILDVLAKIGKQFLFGIADTSLGDTGITQKSSKNSSSRSLGLGTRVGGKEHTLFTNKPYSLSFFLNL